MPMVGDGIVPADGQGISVDQLIPQNSMASVYHTQERDPSAGKAVDASASALSSVDGK